MAWPKCHVKNKDKAKILSIKKFVTYCSLIPISNVKIRNNETKV